jgi:hypothetical protein
VTALLFPLVRQYYMTVTPTQRTSPGLRSVYGGARK